MKKKILIVDDNPENRKLLASIIEKHTSYEVILAKTGHDVLKHFEKKSFDMPDLILLDIIMPGIDGFSVAQKIREIPPANEIPIIFVSGSIKSYDKDKAFKINNCDFISKPFNRYELISRVKMQLTLSDAYHQESEFRGILEEAAASVTSLENLLTEESLPGSEEIMEHMGTLKKNIVRLKLTMDK